MAPLRTTVAVLTYRRPDDLAALLPLLREQVGRLGAEHRVRVLVVDNDPAASAADVVAAHGAPMARCVHEPRPGIAAARNRALDEAGDDDLLVFVDDDERPCDQWLALLLQTWRSSGAQAVVGPVVSSFAEPLDPWIVDGRFFDRRRLATGTAVDVAATNNLLLELGWLRRAGVRFDERFGITGGSDTLFTRQLVASGARMVWCDEAVVTDVVPAARATRSWVLRRAFRSGNGWARTEDALAAGAADRLRRRLRLLVPGAVRTLGGAALWTAGVLTGSRGRRARGLRTAARGSGLLLGLAGYAYAEYRRPAGRG